MVPDDLQILHRSRRGDEHAAEALWTRLSPRLLALARVMTGDHADADDVVQRVFVRVLRLDDLAAAAIVDVTAYFVGAVRNESRNEVRSARRAARVITTRAAMEVSRGGERSEEPLVLEGVIDRLSEDHQEVLRLRHVADLTFAQIATVLEENPNTVASRYRSAIERLRASLENPGAPGPHQPTAPHEVTHG
ncbi:MAG: RNA polymerase sigma factor [Phycisphaerales bacterium]